jgi:riboflavin kinase / FMN adenylyltransferase
VRVFQDFEELKQIPNPVLTIGTFDGVHIGHQRIIEQLNQEADKIGGESVLFTFYPHPRMVLFPDSHGLKLIQTQSEKVDKLRRMGLKNVIVVPFTKEFSRLTAIEFVRDLLVNLINVKKLVIGYDHQFGKNREGTLEFLKEVSEVYGFEVIEIPAQEIDEVNVSSTKIRNALMAGDVATANSFLGESFELNGVVVHGDSIGHQLGYPTANLEVESELKLIPSDGVYIVEVELGEGEIYNGIMNIGVRPTISSEPVRKVEIHLLDYNGDLYGKYLSVKVLDFIRGELKFEDLESLKTQIREDETIARGFFLSGSL